MAEGTLSAAVVFDSCDEPHPARRQNRTLVIAATASRKEVEIVLSRYW